MAPKNKFTKDEMVSAALQIVRDGGIGRLTARAIADRLGISTQPVFTCFATMDAVKNEVRIAAESIFDEYSVKGLREKVPFFGYGMQYIRFAKDEPELYRLLFLSPAPGGESGAMTEMRRAQATFRPSLMNIYGISEADADRYFRDLWLVVHGIATLIVTGGCPYTENEIGQILTGFSLSLCRSIKEIPGFTEGAFDRDAEFSKLIRR